jgi:hypothetical protein
MSPSCLSTAAYLYACSCQTINPLTPVSSRAALLASGGNNFWVDANSCLYIKLTPLQGLHTLIDMAWGLVFGPN